MSCVIFGAGKIARGFIGQLLYMSGIEFSFVEKADALVDLLNERGSYTVNVLGAPEKNSVVTGYKTYKFSDEEKIAEEIAKADCVFDAVGGKNLPQIVPFLVKGIELRAKINRVPLNVVTCENWKLPDEILKEGVYASIAKDALGFCKENVGFSEAVIMRSGIEAPKELLEKDPLIVNVQDYWHLPVDATKLKRPMPGGMICVEPMDDFGGFLERKFYTYNVANGTTSFVGALLGYKYIADAAHDQRIVDLLDGVYKETSLAISRHQNYPYEKQWAFTRTSLNKLQDRNIVDYVERNARDPMRKLGHDDRLVGPALMCLAEGVKPEHVAISIACALFYDEPTDDSAQELKKIRETRGIDGVLEKVCKIDPNGELGLLVKEKVKVIKEWGWLK